MQFKKTLLVLAIAGPASAVAATQAPHQPQATESPSLPVKAASGPTSGSPQAATQLSTVVVTAAAPNEPLILETDPKQPRQPIPAHDGADYLKTMPGFSVIRKGGTDGDPVFRGMAASRVNILMDGEAILGGCGSRMDPPTAYIYPESYDRITLIKGPQTVLHGPGNSAATVLFERDPPYYAEPTLQASGSTTIGSFSRRDVVAEALAGNALGYLRANGTYTEADDYKDGNGNRVHSAYERWNGSFALGWTPDMNTLLELTAALSDGEAAYADRGMDGSKFDRENIGLKFEKHQLSDRMEHLEAQVFYNYVDHVMDNYSLREFRPMGMMAAPMASNPDRETIGGKVLAEINLTDTLLWTLGSDFQQNKHSIRSSTDERVQSYRDMKRVEDARFQFHGIFSELKLSLTDQQRMIGGARVDRWEVEDKRETISTGMHGMGSSANPTADETRKETLYSGFIRYEQDLESSPATVYAGLGHVERFPDYWELFNKEGVDSLSALDTDPEKTTQLDTGLLYNDGTWSASLSLFYNQIQDYILIENNYAKGMRMATVSRNIKARTWGAEATLEYKINEHWKADGSLAYVRGENRTDDVPLAQIPPLEARLGLQYESDAWSVGTLLRLVAEQDRVSVGQGNVVGQDIGENAGFAVLSVNAGWRPMEQLRLSAGVDNLFDRTYAEHISRAGAMVSGFTQTERVNEPGRTLWMRADLKF